MLSKILFYIIIAAVVCGSGYMGWKLTSRNAYESAEYTVLELDANFELRRYPDLMMATTSMNSNSQNGGGSFGRLFRYISGDNQGKQKVAMTTPVFIAPKTDANSGQMGFVIPRDVAETEIPRPSGKKVQLTKRIGGDFAVIRFSGRFNNGPPEEQLSKLTKWLETKGLEAIEEPEVAGYDPPWTPGPFRRNEILIRVSKRAD